MIVKGMYFSCDKGTASKPCNNQYFSPFSLERGAIMDARKRGWIISPKGECICLNCQRDPEVIKNLRGVPKKKILTRNGCRLFGTDNQGLEEECRKCICSDMCSNEDSRG